MLVREFLLELCGFCIVRVCRIDTKSHKRFDLFIDEVLDSKVVHFFAEDNALYLVVD